MTKATEIVAWKVAVEGASLLRKVELKNDMFQAKIHQLKLDMAALESSKAKIEEKSARLKLKLKHTMSSFAKENKELEVGY